MKIAQPIIIGIMPESSVLLIFRGALIRAVRKHVGACIENVVDQKEESQEALKKLIGRKIQPKSSS
jgi:hypothetical protein